MKFNGVRFTNTVLFITVIFLTISGIYGLFWTTSTFMFSLHRAAGWVLLALLPWKAAIIYRSLRRKTAGLRFITGRVLISLLLAAVTLLILALGLVWKGRFGPAEYPLRQTAISWHWMLALGVLLPFALHVWKHWPHPKRVDIASRRSLLRAALISPLALLGALGYRQIARARELAAHPVRFTGSRLAGWYSGNDYPVTHNRAAQPEQIDPAAWRLEVSGDVGRPLRLDYDAFRQLPANGLDATIDCTLGWYARQQWGGVRLADLLDEAGLEREPVEVHFISVTGYAYGLPWEEAQHVLLATHVGGETLSQAHGYPVRAVVPSRRGWFWVKWLAEVKVVT